MTEILSSHRGRSRPSHSGSRSRAARRPPRQPISAAARPLRHAAVKPGLPVSDSVHRHRRRPGDHVHTRCQRPGDTHRWARAPFMGRGVQINGIWCPLTTMCTVFRASRSRASIRVAFRYRASRLVAPDYGEGLVGVRCPSRWSAWRSTASATAPPITRRPAGAAQETITINGNERLTALACPSSCNAPCLTTTARRSPSTRPPGGHFNSVKIDPAWGSTIRSRATATTRRRLLPDHQQLRRSRHARQRHHVQAAGFRRQCRDHRRSRSHWNSISCRRTGQCVAVGDVGAVLVGSAGVVGGSSGPWTTATLPGAADLNAVACPSANRCVAVDSAGHAFALVPAAL